MDACCAHKNTTDRAEQHKERVGVAEDVLWQIKKLEFYS